MRSVIITVDMHSLLDLLDSVSTSWHKSVPDPISSNIVCPCTCTETMALNGYINICILSNFLIGPYFLIGPLS